jgi:hypothetical protein
MRRAHGRHVRWHLPRRGNADYLRCNKKKRETPWVVSKGDEAMAYDVCLDRVPHDSVSLHQKTGSKRSVLRRWLDAVMASQQRRADREIARYVTTAGRFTDEVEREIERRFLYK